MHGVTDMILLILGLVMWSAAHLFKRIAPGLRQSLGARAKGGVALALVLSIVLMVIGYRAAPVIPVWSSPGFLTHVNNLLMVLAFYLYAASGAKTAITRVIRHPQLTAVKLWAVAHLLVNGDVASILLFGGMLAWAVVTVIVLNRAEPVWVRPAPVPARKEITAVVATIVVVAIVMAIHTWLGVRPFG
jgi:uncharacterized membrane protein